MMDIVAWRGIWCKWEFGFFFSSSSRSTYLDDDSLLLGCSVLSDLFTLCESSCNDSDSTFCSHPAPPHSDPNFKFETIRITELSISPCLSLCIPSWRNSVDFTRAVWDPTCQSRHENDYYDISVAILSLKSGATTNPSLLCAQCELQVVIMRDDYALQFKSNDSTRLPTDWP